MRIAIIGTAGRSKDPKEAITLSLYRKMINRVDRCFVLLDPSATVLVSGGAAISDHIAIELFLKHNYGKLELHLPAPFDLNKKRYVENGFGSPGSTSNYYHNRFSKNCDVDSLDEIAQCHEMETRCSIKTYDGFFARNLEVGKVSMLIALTWGEGNEPADGGTLHTWRHSKAKTKIHIPISTLR